MHYLMNLRKAKKEDFDEYLKLKREEEKEYSQIIQEKIPHLSKKECKKDFNEIFSSKNNILMAAEENKKLTGFLYGTFQGKKNTGKGYIEVIFVSKKHRNCGVGSNLIYEFIHIAKEKGYHKIQLSVNIHNITALKLYEEIGFKIFKYELKKKI